MSDVALQEKSDSLKTSLSSFNLITKRNFVQPLSHGIFMAPAYGTSVFQANSEDADDKEDVELEAQDSYTRTVQWVPIFHAKFLTSIWKTSLFWNSMIILV